MARIALRAVCERAQRPGPALTGAQRQQLETLIGALGRDPEQLLEFLDDEESLDEPLGDDEGSMQERLTRWLG